MKVTSTLSLDNYSRLFAVLVFYGRQFKVTTDDIISTPSAFTPSLGEKIIFRKVLLVGSSSFSLIGRPLINHDIVSISGTVIERSANFPVMAYTRFKRSPRHSLKLHQTILSYIRINSIDIDYSRLEGHF